MADAQEQRATRNEFTRQELETIGGYLPEMLRSLADQSIVRTYLGIGFVLGLVVQVVAYLLKPAAGGEPFALIIDLLYALGWSLWTGVVVSFFVQVLPEAKRRQIVRGLQAYEAYRAAQGVDPEVEI
jgi:hypothetical protein